MKWHNLTILGFIITAFSGCATIQEKNTWNTVNDIEQHYSNRLTETLPELNENSSLSDFIAYAALSNPSLEATFNLWKSALGKIPQVRSLPDPKFSYAYFIIAVETKAGPQRQKFALSQTFPWYGTLLLRGEAAFENAEAKRKEYDSEKLKLFYKVKEAYYNYYFLARSIDIVGKNLELFKEMQRIAGEEYDTAAAKYTDYLKIQIETAKFANRLASLKDFKEPVLARLNYVLNRGMNQNIDYPKAIHADNINLPSEAFLQKLVKSNPELEKLDHLAEREKKNADLARRRYIPDLTIGAEYIETGRGNGSGNGKDPIIAMVSFNLPINFNKYEAERREAKAKHQSFLLGKKDKTNFLMSELKQRLFMLRDSKREISLYRDILIPKSKKSLSATKYAYIAGTADYLDFIDAQQTLLKFELLYEENLVKYAKSVAKIEELIGKELEKTKKILLANNLKHLFLNELNECHPKTPVIN